MARERARNTDPEVSLCSRREYLQAAGLLTGGIGLAAASDRAAAADPDPVAEADSVDVNDSWTSVRLSNSYNDPVVVAGPLSYTGPQPATPRLKNVTEAGFELTVEEWLYLDGAHLLETVGYVAVDPGVHRLSNGAILVVGSVSTDHRWHSETFGSSFSSRPLVFSAVQTTRGPQPVTIRHRNVSRSGFDVRVQEEEAQGPHRTEDVGYLAVEPGIGTLGGRAFEAGVRTGVGHGWKSISFSETYRDPVFIADLQTYRGWNTCAVRYRNLSGSGVEVKVEEEWSADQETAHLGEDIGYLVLEGATDSEETVEMTSPIERNGQLHVSGTDLCNEDGEPVQLTGMSTHGIQWFGWDNCVTSKSLDALAEDWGADLCRVAMYVQSDGYETDPEGFTAEVNTIVEEITARGMYALIDFHILDLGNPMDNLDNAKRFFDDVAAEHADKENVIFEICNEPNGVDWGSIKTYAEEVIPVIRKHDPVSPIVVGTRGWSSLGFADIGPEGPQEIIDNPVDDDNVIYAYHFYAATHGEWERNELEKAANELPIFVTEWGSMEASGDGESDFQSAEAFLDVMARNNISWANWNYSTDWRTSGVWKEEMTDGGWVVDNLTETGRWVRERIRNS